MAPARRKSARKKETQPDESEGEAEAVKEATPEQEEKSKETCPACEDSTNANSKTEGDTWIRCDACKKWFHWDCVAEEKQDHETVGHWYCKPCRKEDLTRVITFKPPARKSTRKKAQRDYASLNAGLESDPDKWQKLMENKTIVENNFQRKRGDEVTLDWLISEDSALHEPIVIENPEGLGMKMPGPDFEVRDVLKVLGADTPLEVIDVHTQSNIRDWNLEKWANYYYTEPQQRDKIRNVISLEISDTELASDIVPPRIFRDLDWVQNFWPASRRGAGHQYPKVQLYCLMGVARAWTDWHIDFAGSSVYYHVLRGAKTFYFIRPTPANLSAYEKWSGSETQNHVWLGDMVDEVTKIELHQGNTMIIPTGWIHAVHTPQDSLVFGGNFLHSYNISTQLRIREIEISTQVPKKFRFPYFVKLCWYVAEQYLRDLKAKEEIPKRVLDSLDSLSHFLVAESRTIERGSDVAKREAKDMVPSDKVKDPCALARELRWRVQHALGGSSGDEGKPKGKSQLVTTNGIHKRKRGISQIATSEDRETEPPLFKHFKPRGWDLERRLPGGLSVIHRTAPKPPDEKLGEKWLLWEENEEATRKGPPENDDDAEVEIKKDVIVRARRFVQNGVTYVERHRAERLLEVWRWPSPSQDVSQVSDTDHKVETPSTEGPSMATEDVLQ